MWVTDSELRFDRFDSFAALLSMWFSVVVVFFLPVAAGALNASCHPWITAGNGKKKKAFTIKHLCNFTNCSLKQLRFISWQETSSSFFFFCCFFVPFQWVANYNASIIPEQVCYLVPERWCTVRVSPPQTKVTLYFTFWNEPGDLSNSSQDPNGVAMSHSKGWASVPWMHSANSLIISCTQ